MAAPAYSWAAAGGGTTTTSDTVTLPATAADDIAIFAVVLRESALTPTLGGTFTPTLTSIHALTTGGAPSVHVYWARGTGNHSGQTITASHASATSMAACVAGFTGALASGSPIDTNKSSVRVASATTPVTLTAFNTTVDETLIVLGTGGTDDALNQTGHAKDGGSTAMTLRGYAESTGGLDCQIGFATVAQASAGSTGTLQLTCDMGGGDFNQMFAFAIKPPVGASPDRRGPLPRVEAPVAVLQSYVY